MQTNKKMEREVEPGMAFAAVFLIVFMVLAPTAFAMGFYPQNRQPQLQELAKYYPSLKDPEKSFKNAYEQREREVVFVNKGKNWALLPEGKYDVIPAVFYMAEVEAKAGRQPWLDEAYKTYTLTEDELAKLVKLDRQFEEHHSVAGQPSVKAQEVLKQRHISVVQQ